MASIGGQQANEVDKLILSLPRERGLAVPYVYLYQDFWCPSTHIQGTITSQKYFHAKDSDVVIASFPKSGTTWLKALTFAIVNRQRLFLENHPLLTSNPHELVPAFEFIFGGDINDQIPHHLSNMTEPRLLGSHAPFPSLPKSVEESNCKIIYICRNPFDNFVSFWFYMNKIKSESLPALTMEEVFEHYCKGVIVFGPFWDHMLGYWKESIARPNRVLFLKYDDLKEDINFHVKRIATFLGCPFTQEEESSGVVVESIIKLCSFEKMKDLEVNKSGIAGLIIQKKHLFRKGETGDWVNYFSPSMVEKLSKVIEEKLSGSGLSFKM